VLAIAAIFCPMASTALRPWIVLEELAGLRQIGGDLLACLTSASPACAASRTGPAGDWFFAPRRMSSGAANEQQERESTVSPSENHASDGQMPIPSECGCVIMRYVSRRYATLHSDLPALSGLVNRRSTRKGAGRSRHDSADLVAKQKQSPEDKDVKLRIEAAVSRALPAAIAGDVIAALPVDLVAENGMTLAAPKPTWSRRRPSRSTDGDSARSATSIRKTNRDAECYGSFAPSTIRGRRTTASRRGPPGSLPSLTAS